MTLVELSAVMEVQAQRLADELTDGKRPLLVELRRQARRDRVEQWARWFADYRRYWAVA